MPKCPASRIIAASPTLGVPGSERHYLHTTPRPPVGTAAARTVAVRALPLGVTGVAWEGGAPVAVTRRADSHCTCPGGMPAFPRTHAHVIPCPRPIRALDPCRKASRLLPPWLAYLNAGSQRRGECHPAPMAGGTAAARSVAAAKSASMAGCAAGARSAAAAAIARTAGSATNARSAAAAAIARTGGCATTARSAAAAASASMGGSAAGARSAAPRSVRK